MRMFEMSQYQSDFKRTPYFVPLFHYIVPQIRMEKNVLFIVKIAFIQVKVLTSVVPF